MAVPRRSAGPRSRSEAARDAHHGHQLWIGIAATRAAALKQKHALGYADAFAAELAIERGAWLVTADPEFSKVGQALSIYSLPRRTDEGGSPHLTTPPLYAPTASCPPSGKKYCVPLIGSVTLRSSSCKSSLRSTKSMSEVFTISRSEDV